MGLFKKKKPTEYATLSLNMRLLPQYRGMYYEDMLQKILKKHKIGVVDGGGTEFTPEDGPLSCDVNIDYHKEKEEELIEILRKYPATKGSKIILGEGDDEKSIDIGEMEGLAIYLNGTDLDKEVYDSCDINVVISELSKLMGGDLAIFSFWTGSKETALYFYGKDYENMRASIESFITTYPLCQKCRIEQLV